MAKITKGYTFGSTELVTNTKLHTLVDSATVSDVASDGANSDITSLAGLTTPLSVAQGGTGSATQNFVNNDGTVNPTNLLSNGNFESWSAGASAAPDGWELADGGVAREGTIKKLGSYSAKFTRNGTNCHLNQSVHTEKGSAYWDGRTITFGAWVYATVADRVRLTIWQTGPVIASSDFHTGDSTWRWLTVTTTISGTSQVITPRLSIYTGDTTAYFDGAMCVEGASAFAFSPKPAEEGVWADYSAVSTIVGWSSFTTKLIYTKKIGKTVLVGVHLYGTSNATTVSFTLPYTCKDVRSFGFLRAYDNGSYLSTAGIFELTEDSSTVTCYTTPAANVWTNSGNKGVMGLHFSYETT